MKQKLDNNLAVPTLHINGSGWNNLYEQYRRALGAIKEARDALPVPHGRDYYVQDDDAYTKARAQFETQLDKLNEVEAELKAILEKVYEQHETRH